MLILDMVVKLVTVVESDMQEDLAAVESDMQEELVAVD